MAKLDIKAKTWEKNPALLRIMKMLEDAFNSVGEKIRGDLLKAYREYAKDAYDNFIRNIETKSGEIPRDRYGRQQHSNWHVFADYAGGTHRPFQTWGDMRAVIGNFSLTYKYAERDANDAYEHARDSFVYKNMDKMTEVLGKREDLKNAVLRFDWRGGAFVGNVQIYLEGAYFRGELSIKYVIRTIPRVTPYFQYPLVFAEAEIDGKHYARPSEVELRNLLSGKSSQQHEKELAAKAAAEGWCPSSGTMVPADLMKGQWNRTSPWVKCQICGSGVSAQHGKFRKHKTLVAEKMAVASKLEASGYCPMSNQAAPYALIAPFIRSYTVYPAGQPKKEFSFDLFDSAGKYRKIPCGTCGQEVVIGDSRGAYEAEKVRALYRKHKLAK